MRFSDAAIMVMIAGKVWQAVLKEASEPNRSNGGSRHPCGRAINPAGRGGEHPCDAFSRPPSLGHDLYVVTERAFGVHLDDGLVITLSHKHTDYR